MTQPSDTRPAPRGRSDYARVEAAIRFLEAHGRTQPRLEDVAEAVGLSPFHFQRLFTRWAGISPKRFLQYQTLAHAQRLLAERRSLLDVTLEAGLSGGGRLHDLFVALHAVTPGEYKRGGEGLVLHHGVHASPFGDFVLASGPRGVCGLQFVGEGGEAAALAALQAQWPGATWVRGQRETAVHARAIFARAAGETPRAPLPVWVRGTNFQVKVWEALLRIPPGGVATYGDVAAAVGAPGASRAVGSAVGDNPVAFLIPCHRVIRQTGAFGEYRWGGPRKRAMLAWEAARAAGAGEGA